MAALTKHCYSQLPYKLYIFTFTSYGHFLRVPRVSAYESSHCTIKADLLHTLALGYRTWLSLRAAAFFCLSILTKSLAQATLRLPSKYKADEVVCFPEAHTIYIGTVYSYSTSGGNGGQANSSAGNNHSQGANSDSDSGSPSQSEVSH